jgi:hypothetical protein
MTIKCKLTMLTFTKTKNTRLPDSVHNAGVTLQSRDIPHTLPSPIFYEHALVKVLFRTRNLGQHFFDISKKKYVNQSLVSLINDNY